MEFTRLVTTKSGETHTVKIFFKELLERGDRNGVEPVYAPLGTMTTDRGLPARWDSSERCYIINHTIRAYGDPPPAHPNAKTRGGAARAAD